MKKNLTNQEEFVEKINQLRVKKHNFKIIRFVFKKLNRRG
ncbi:hypothetical protein GvMRE_I1g738 [endosymbiont GvMRE of Glomus versiforme]|nr:hypothetical protein GvMRE_Ic5g24 [endosymbiont GvMRE of Glomus versiforme]RHZ35797.1 hypothetical protein GvMRE_Ic5g23 [endosymbiont GvMRE of Glomus versiforme]RHZ37429.1 hypothetical protein GvMRE_I1g738 [endosymbiont GvMRE of Glomus versiforme]